MTDMLLVERYRAKKDAAIKRLMHCARTREKIAREVDDLTAIDMVLITEKLGRHLDDLIESDPVFGAPDSGARKLAKRLREEAMKCILIGAETLMSDRTKARQR